MRRTSPPIGTEASARSSTPVTRNIVSNNTPPPVTNHSSLSSTSIDGNDPIIDSTDGNRGENGGSDAETESIFFDTVSHSDQTIGIQEGEESEVLSPRLKNLSVMFETYEAKFEDGCDSDGFDGYFSAEDDYEEEVLDEIKSNNNTEDLDSRNVNNKLPERKKSESLKDKYMSDNSILQLFTASEHSIFSSPFIEFYEWLMKDPHAAIKVIVYPKDEDNSIMVVVSNLRSKSIYDAVYERLFVKDKETLKFHRKMFLGPPDDLSIIFESETDPLYLNRCTEIRLEEEYANVLKSISLDGGGGDDGVGVENGFVDIPHATIESMKNDELRHQLKIRGQKIKGKKSELIDKLKLAILSKIPVGKKKEKKIAATAIKIDENKEIKGFKIGAYWEELLQSALIVPEPDNVTFKNARAPTEVNVDKVPDKYNFTAIFDRPTFEGKSKMPIVNNDGVAMMNTNGTPKWNEVKRDQGGPNPDFLKKHGLSAGSHPTEFVEAFLPQHLNMYSTPKCEYPSLAQWTTFSNLKASLSNAGPEGVVYPDFVPFTVEDIRQNIGIYFFNGLNPSPQVEMKFKHPSQDPVHGNAFIYQNFGPNASRRHKHFKSFFAVQDPRINIPTRSLFPNWKIRPLLKWMLFVFQLAWCLGAIFSVDEQTVGFQGKHADKLRITYKAEGDGFQCDALCENGFTYQFYFRNEPPPKRYKGMSPLHARVMALFDTLQDKYHSCSLDNLYNSALFCRHAFNHPKKVMVGGVTRKGMRGIPKCVVQEEQLSKKNQDAVRGTTKAAVLKGDDECPSLIASSVYDSKPVHFLSMMSKEIKWVEKERITYNVDTGRNEVMKFLRLDHIDNYNNTMGHVDVSDQLRNTYHFDHWLRKQKWWWSILFWGIGVILTNAYVIYVFVNVRAGKQKNSCYPITTLGRNWHWHGLGRVGVWCLKKRKS